MTTRSCRAVHNNVPIDSLTSLSGAGGPSGPIDGDIAIFVAVVVNSASSCCLLELFFDFDCVALLIILVVRFIVILVIILVVIIPSIFLTFAITGTSYFLAILFLLLRCLFRFSSWRLLLFHPLFMLLCRQTLVRVLVGAQYCPFLVAYKGFKAARIVDKIIQVSHPMLAHFHRHFENLICHSF